MPLRVTGSLFDLVLIKYGNIHKNRQLPQLFNQALVVFTVFFFAN